MLQIFFVDESRRAKSLKIDWVFGFGMGKERERKRKKESGRKIEGNKKRQMYSQVGRQMDRQKNKQRFTA